MRMLRQHIVAVIAAISAGAFLLTPAAATGGPIADTEAAAATTDIQIVTINDFHGRIEQNLGAGEAGAAVIAGAVAQLQADNPNTLFVSAGDNVGASTFTSFISNDDPAIDALRAAGLALGAVGNHEFDQGYADVTDRIDARFGGPIFGLGANVYEKGTRIPALQEYAVAEVAGVRIGFIGVVTPDTATMVTPRGVADVEFGDMLDAANRVAAAIVDEVDVTILLAHDGMFGTDCAQLAEADSPFAALVREASTTIDAIVSGHTHEAYACVAAGPDGAERPVIQAHRYGTTLGLLELSVNTTSKELASATGSLVPLIVDEQAAYPADPAVAQLVAEAVAEADVLGSVPVGRISADIVRGGTPPGDDRGVESSLGNFIADLYVWATSNPDYAGTPAQLGLMNPGGLRADLLYGADGTMTVRDVANVQPFANTLVTMTLSAAQLRRVLEQQWEPDGSMLHMGVSADFAYTYDPAAPFGSHVTSMMYQGAPVADDDAFTVVVHSFMAAGGDGVITFTEGTDRIDTGQVDLAATVAYFEAHDVVDPAPLGRAVVGQAPADVPAGEVTIPGTGGELPWGIALGIGCLVALALLWFMLRGPDRTGR